MHPSNAASSTDPKEKCQNINGMSTINGLNVASKIQSQYSLGASKHLSKSTLAAIIDNYAKKWLLRVDRPHKGANYHHVNINGFLTKVRDPHMKISPATAKVLGASHAVCMKAGDWLPWVSTAINAGRLASAVYEDAQSEAGASFPKKTAQTLTVIAGENVGGNVGFSVGAKIGTEIGGFVGNVPGAAIGSLVGGLMGCVVGANQGARAANLLWESSEPSEMCSKI